MPLNFSFGANMDTRCLVDRRGIRPRSAKAAVLHGYALSFDYPGMPFAEPAFANVQPARGKEVHGVLLDLTDEDWDKLLRLEGGAGSQQDKNTYAIEHVAVNTYDGETVDDVRIFRYVHADASGPRAFPSERYAFLLSRGARNSGLSDEYCRFLDEQPRFSPHGLGLVPHLLLKHAIIRPFFLLVQFTSKNGLPTAWLWFVMHSLIKPAARAFDSATGHKLSAPRTPPPDLASAFPKFSIT